jgi:hypothetical protein
MYTQFLNESRFESVTEYGFMDTPAIVIVNLSPDDGDKMARMTSASIRRIRYALSAIQSGSAELEYANYFTMNERGRVIGVLKRMSDRRDRIVVRAATVMELYKPDDPTTRVLGQTFRNDKHAFIELCVKSWRDQSDSENMRVMVHELAHQYGAEDLAGGKDPAKALIGTARGYMNADSFAYFVMDIKAPDTSAPPVSTRAIQTQGITGSYFREKLVFMGQAYRPTYLQKFWCKDLFSVIESGDEAKFQRLVTSATEIPEPCSKTALTMALAVKPSIARTLIAKNVKSYRDGRGYIQAEMMGESSIASLLKSRLPPAVLSKSNDAITECKSIMKSFTVDKITPSVNDGCALALFQDALKSENATSTVKRILEKFPSLITRHNLLTLINGGRYDLAEVLVAQVDKIAHPGFKPFYGDYLADAGLLALSTVANSKDKAENKKGAASNSDMTSLVKALKGLGPSQDALKLASDSTDARFLKALASAK